VLKKCQKDDDECQETRFFIDDKLHPEMGLEIGCKSTKNDAKRQAFFSQWRSPKSFERTGVNWQGDI